MPNNNNNNTVSVTAKQAASIIRGEQVRVLSQAKVDAIHFGRIAAVMDGTAHNAKEEVEKAAARTADSLFYAECALAVFKHNGKSAVKEAQRLGVLPKRVLGTGSILPSESGEASAPGASTELYGD